MADTSATVAKAQSHGINKTNLEYIKHHLSQSAVSLDRAVSRAELVTKGKSGRLSTELSRVNDFTVFQQLAEMRGIVNGVINEIEDLF